MWNILIEKVGKDNHLLTKSDLKVEDKMNYSSAEKMYSTAVIKLLHENFEVRDIAPGAAAYLKLMQCIITAFLDESVNITCRVYGTAYSFQEHIYCEIKIIPLRTIFYRITVMFVSS